MRRRVLRIKNPDIQLRRITYPPKQIPPSPSLGVIDGVALLVEEWGRRSGYSSGGYVIRLNVRLPTPRRGNDTSAQGIALRTGCSKYSAPKGQKNKAHTRRLWEGEAAFHSFAPAGRNLDTSVPPRRCLGLSRCWPFFLHFVLKASKLERRPCRLRRIAYPPEQIFLSPSLGVIDRVA